MNAAKIFGAGIPTAPDVDKLWSEFGTPSAGVVISYDRIAETIGCARDSYRFNSVVSAWRKRLFQQSNVVLRSVVNTGYEVLNNQQRVYVSVGTHKQGLRKIRRASEVAARTDSEGLTTEHIRARDHVVRVGATLQLTAATAARELRLTK